MNFWETFRKSTVDVAKWWQFLRPVQVKTQNRYYVTIPPFQVNNVDPIDPSFIVLEFRLRSTVAFGISGISVPPTFSPSFTLAVRNPINNTDGHNVRRYKLWPSLGEKLYYPNYNGETLGTEASFEIWTIAPPVTQVVNSLPFNIQLTLLAEPSSMEFCCSPSNVGLTTDGYCALFEAKNQNGNYDVPMVFDLCLNDATGETHPGDDFSGIITEDGTAFIGTEDDKTLRTEDQAQKP